MQLEVLVAKFKNPRVDGTTLSPGNDIGRFGISSFLGLKDLWWLFSSLNLSFCVRSFCVRSSMSQMFPFNLVLCLAG